MSAHRSCPCSTAPKLIFACSGAADVGQLSDLAARRLTQQGVGKMSCLAGVGGRVAGIMKSAESASSILAIDGCPLNCVKECLQLGGIMDFEHLQLADLGLVKGQSPPTDDRVAAVTARGAELLNDARVH
jgi:uncharacterized metal-binding protein